MLIVEPCPCCKGEGVGCWRCYETGKLEIKISEVARTEDEQLAIDLHKQAQAYIRAEWADFPTATKDLVMIAYKDGYMHGRQAHKEHDQ